MVIRVIALTRVGQRQSDVLVWAHESCFCEVKTVSVIVDTLNSSAGTASILTLPCRVIRAAVTAGAVCLRSL